MWYNKVVGQKKTLDALHRSISNDTISHAIIIDGPSGYGGLPMVLSIVQHLLCMSPDEDRACGHCKSCQQVEGIIHPDLHIAYPVVKKDGVERKNTTAKDFMSEWRASVLNNPYITVNEWINTIAKTSANGDINTKECNEIIQQLNFQAFSGENKVQIIWIADHLGTNGNKLLKLIEEPPEKTFIILICNSLDLILGTIISRCRVISLPRLDEQDISTALETHREANSQTAEQIAHICDGDFSQALQFAQIEHNDLMDLCIQWMDICDRYDMHTIRQWSTTYSRYNKEEQKAILIYFLKILQAVMYHHLLGNQYVKLSEGDKARILANKAIMSLDNDGIDRLSKIVSQMISNIGRYVNSRMVMFDACLTIGQELKRN